MKWKPTWMSSSSSLSSASLSSEPFDFFAFGAAFLVGAALALAFAGALGESLPEPPPDLPPSSESDPEDDVGEPPSEDEAWKSSSRYMC